MNSPTLNEMQTWFRWAVSDPRGIEGVLNDHDFSSLGWFKSRPEPKPRLLPFIVDGNPLSANKRLSIYTTAYFERLIEALKLNFSALTRALDEDTVRDIFVRYLVLHPSRSPNIDEVGEGLASFLDDHSIAEEEPYLPDLARLEWRVLVGVYTDRLPPFDSTVLEKISADQWSTARFTLDPTVHLMETDYAVDRLWRDRLLPQGKGKHRLSGQNPRNLLIYRDDDWVQVRSLSRPEWQALKYLSEGLNLDRVCEELAEKFESQGEPIRLQEWFAEWIRAGVVKEIRF